MSKKQQQIVLIKGGVDWSRVEDVVQNAVVQVFAQVGRFNWLEPYNVQEEAENRGSGFLINQDGYIITNAHVVHEAKRIWVHVPILGRHMIHVEIVGFCPERDIALLRIVPKQLSEMRTTLQSIPFISLGNSDGVRRADNVMVLGYPLGQYRLKSSTGVVSGREATVGQAFIQFTAAINPGSSGGPLLDENGQVIGITIATVTDAQNVGYAIPINELRQILDDLYTKRLVRVPVLGIQFVYANDSKAEFLGNPVPAGVYVINVLKNSLCEKAGVQVGDMLYEFNGFPLDAYGDTAAPWGGGDITSWTDLIARIKIGQKVKLAVYRKGQRIEIEIVFELSEPNPIREMFPDYEPIEYETIGGMVILQLADNHLPLLLPEAPDLFRYAKADEKYKSVLIITHVLPGSLAQQLRSIAPGDRIMEVNGAKVSTLASFRTAVRKSLTTGFLTLKTERDVFAVFNVHDLLKEEKQLSKDFAYPLSKLVEQMIRKTANPENAQK